MTNKEVMDNLYKNYIDEKFAHLYLFETNNLDSALTDIKLLIKKMYCDSSNQENLESLIDNDNLSSLIIIKPNGKDISKDEIDNIKIRFKNKPLLTKDNIYIILSPEKMNSTAFNKMLKFMEEPEEHIIGFLITDNKKSMPDTILSRCEPLKLLYDETSKEENEELQADAKAFINVITGVTKEDVVLYINKEITSKYNSREDIVSLIKIMYTIFNDLLHTDISNSEKNIKSLNVIAKYLEQLNFNININLLLESMAVELGELYGI